MTNGDGTTDRGVRCADIDPHTGIQNPIVEHRETVRPYRCVLVRTLRHAMDNGHQANNWAMGAGDRVWNGDHGTASGDDQQPTNLRLANAT